MLTPCHPLDLWALTRKLDREQALRATDGEEMRAVYSQAYSGGPHAALSGKVFCLGGYDKCQAFLREHHDLVEELSLRMVDLEDLATNLDLEDNEIPERDSRWGD